MSAFRLAVWSIACATSDREAGADSGLSGLDTSDSSPDSADSADDSGAHSGESAESGDSGDCDKLTWYRDSDGDSFGDPNVSELACAAPEGFVADATDCDDAHAEAHPDAAERWTDGIDDDCDGFAANTSMAALSLWQAVGARDNAGVGVSVAVDGDFNGDGVPDLAVGSQLGTFEGSARGGLTLVFDGPLVEGGDPLTESSASASLYGDLHDMVSIVCVPGDLDDDGFDDLVIGNPLGDNYRGAAYIARGPLEGSIDRTVDMQAYLGTNVGESLGLCAGPGDVDGDAIPDVVLSSSESNGGGLDGRGSVYLLRGPVEHSSVEDAEQVLRGTSDMEAIGTHVAAVGDLNGDGMYDYGVSNGGYGSSSTDGVAVYLVNEYATGEMHPSEVGVTVHYDLSGSPTDMFANRIGDIDGDGYDDVAFAPNGGSDTLRVISGPFGAESSRDLSKDSATSFTSSVGGPNRWLTFAASLGDWTGDGTGALAIADPVFATEEALSHTDCTSGAGCSQGAVYLVAEPIDAGSHDLAAEADRLEGVYPDAHLGGSTYGPALHGGSDLTGDGFPDLAFGAYYADAGSDDYDGAAWVLFGGGSP